MLRLLTIFAMFLVVEANPVQAQHQEAALQRVAIPGAGFDLVVATGNKVVHRVVASWNEAWTGTDQVRFFELDGKKLKISTAPNVNLRDGRRTVSTLTFEKLD